MTGAEPKADVAAGLRDIAGDLAPTFYVPDPRALLEQAAALIESQKALLAECAEALGPFASKAPHGLVASGLDGCMDIEIDFSDLRRLAELHRRLKDHE